MKSCNGETAKANMSMKKRTFHCKLIRYFIRLKGAHEGQIIVFDKEPIPQENQHLGMLHGKGLSCTAMSEWLGHLHYIQKAKIW